MPYFPTSPAPVDGDLWPLAPAEPVWVYSGTAGKWVPLGMDGDDVADELPSVLGTDKVPVGRVVSGTLTWYMAALSTLGTLFGSGSSPTVPAAMVDTDWSATPVAGGIAFQPLVAPANGGAAITGYEVSTNGGTSWSLLPGGAALTARQVLGLSETPYNTMMRAVNSVGGGPNSDTKTRTPLPAGVTFIDFAPDAGMTETANGSGFDYVGTVANAAARGSTYTIADEANGSFKVQITNSTGSAIAIAGLYFNDANAWDDNVYALAYPVNGVGSDWVCTRGLAESYQNLAIATVTHQANDWVRFTVNDEDVTVEIARAATPNTWIPLASANIPHALLKRIKLTSFNGAGASFSLPQVG